MYRYVSIYSEECFWPQYMYPKLSPFNDYRWYPLGKLSHLGLEKLNYTFTQSSPIKLPTFCSSFSYLWQIFLSLFCLCGYHGCCCAYLSCITILYKIQVQSYQNIVVALVLTGNCQINGAIVNYIIGSSIVVEFDLRTVLLVCMALSSHCLTVPSIGSGGGGGHVLKNYLSVVVWMNFWVVTRIDIALGNMKAYQRLLGIVSVMTIIDIYCNFTDYCPHLPSLTMLKM